MSRQIIDIGIQGNDGTGDSIRESFRKVNDNFTQLFSIFGSGETIALTDLDDTPKAYLPSLDDQASLLVANDAGNMLLSKRLVGGTGVIIDNTDPNQITILGGNGEVIADDNPTLGNHLNANGYVIGNVANLADLSQTEIQNLLLNFNNLHSTSITEDDVVITRGYADRRYLQSTSEAIGTGSQIRVRLEPPTADEYTYTVGDWVGGLLFIQSHGFNTGVNGAGFVYHVQLGFVPADGLQDGETYYIRYVNSDLLGVYPTSSDAINDTNRIDVNVNIVISPALRGVETFVDKFYDPTLFGNWVSNEALPRVSVVRRQGDRMDGPLYLQDHPGSLAGIGTPNGLNDLQAATKLYVDQSSFASVSNLFVATSGDDSQVNTPAGKEGRAFAYAYATLGAACQKAEELINSSLKEPGPYRQPITYDSGNGLSTITASSTVAGSKRLLQIYTNAQGVDQSKEPTNRDLREGSIIKGLGSGATAKVISYNGTVGVNDEYVVQLLQTTTDPNNFQANFVFASAKLLDNKEFIAQETIAYINAKYPSLTYDESACLRDSRLIVDALAFDVKFGGNKRTLEAARKYWRGALSALPTNQLNETLDGIDYIFLLAEQVIQNNVIAAAPDPVSFGKRTALSQDVSGTDGEANAVPLTRRLVDSILDILANGLNGSGTLLEFQADELLEYGQLVPELQITIRVESGVYYEQLPIRVPANVSIKGDEFRRVIIRPAFGESLSPWARIYFFRDDHFDGLTRTYTASGASSSLVGSDYVVTVGSTVGLESGMYVKVTGGTGLLSERTQVKDILSNTQFTLTLAPLAPLVGANIRGLNSCGLAPTGEKFAYHYLTDPSDPNSPPKENKDMDVFLLNDATILRNITCQSHGGFMCVLDPEGQIQTKSPYFQTATTLSASTGKQRFAGGMLVDGSAGNLPASILSKTSPFELVVGNLNVRLPQVPTSFYIQGRRYQVNEIERLPTPGQATIYLDTSSNAGNGYDETQFTVNPGVVARDIIFETAGNRSMLANDFTQVNDLGYGCVATNNGISELVSVFTYYCWTSYYSVNGGQIRSTQGNSSYGQYGMRAAGRDLNEVPDPVLLAENTLQVAKIFKRDSFSGKNLAGEISVYVDNYQFIPYTISEIEIDHSSTRSKLAENSPSFSNITLTNPGSGYQVGQQLKPTTGVTFGNNTYTQILVTGVDGSGAITSWTIVDPGDYSVAPITVKQQGTFNVDAHPENGIALGAAAGAVFTGTYIGQRQVYEVSSVERTTILGNGFNSVGTPITTLPVLKLNLQSATNSALFSSLVDGQTVILRGLQNFKFNGVEEIKPVRPSTALEFVDAAESGSVYRTLAYGITNAVGDSLAADEAVLTFDTSYDYAIILTNPSRLGDVDYVDGGPKTMGASVGDTRIAVSMTDASEIARLNSGNMITAWAGKLFRITSYVPPVLSNSGYIVLDDLDYGLGSVVNVAGLSEGLPRVEQVILRAGIDAGSAAEITVRISTCRASGHDFLDVGTGGFTSSNYPNNLYGAPVITKDQTKEVREETQGRVFYASTDQDGIFRVGRFFTVDQGTGSVTFAASIALSNLDGIGFKRGTVVKEFSTDDTMTDAASDTVPTESAIVGYISKRLGITPTGGVVPEVERIPASSGFISVTGAIPMTGNLNMGSPSNRIINLASPIATNDAATKAYVDNQVASYDELSELIDVTISALNTNDILAYNGTKWVNTLITNSNVDAAAAIAQSKLSLTAASTRANATGITQADLGVVSFDSANFEITNGWVGIKNNGVSYSEIQNVTAGRILGNLTGSATTIQEILPSSILTSGLDSLATSIDAGATVITLRRNRIKTSPSSTFTSIIGSAVAGSATITNVPATSITGSGSGARFNVTYSAGNYTTITAVYGGSGYAEGDRLSISGAVLGGAAVTNDLAFTIQVTGSNLDTGTIFGVQKVSTTAEANSIVITDSSKNLGNAGNKFGTIYTTNVSAADISATGTVSGSTISGSTVTGTTVSGTNVSASATVSGNNVNVVNFVKYGIDGNVTATGTDQVTAYAIGNTITHITTVPANSGVRLPIPTNALGYRIVIINASGVAVKVWPNSGGSINNAIPDTSYNLDTGTALEFLAVNSTTWFTLNATFSG